MEQQGSAPSGRVPPQVVHQLVKLPIVQARPLHTVRWWQIHGQLRVQQARQAGWEAAVSALPPSALQRHSTLRCRNHRQMYCCTLILLMASSVRHTEILTEQDSIKRCDDIILDMHPDLLASGE